jgi:methionine biosynthesis protein MetW
MDSRVISLLTGNECVLDLGCGDGWFLERLGNRYEVAIGIDIDTPNELRASKYQSWSYVRGDLDSGIPVRTSCADVVHANQVIEHLKNPLAFLTEAYRTLKPGGRLIITTPNVRYVRHLWRLAARGHGPITSTRATRTVTEWDDGHIHFFTPTDLVWIASQAGFSIVRTAALVDRAGRYPLLRVTLDRLAGGRLVKSFLSGNTLLLAHK